jgi:hypothetical protein
MRPLHAFPIVAAVLLGVGCSLFEKQKDTPRPSTPIQSNLTADQLVTYLNDRASLMQWVTADVQVVAHKGIVSYTLRGDLFANQPRNFRLICEGGVGGKVDLGSNAGQFWAYVHVPASDPLFVYAMYKDFESGQAKMPGGMPFEPEWVMQALGMHKYPTNLPYVTPRLNPSDRTFTLAWPTTTPDGIAIKKEVVFDADQAKQGQPQVKKHLIRDNKDRVICSAEVKAVQTVAVASPNPRSPQPDPRDQGVYIQCPTKVVLKWEAQSVQLDLNLSKVQVNQPLGDEQARRIFTRPDNVGTQPLNLAEHRFMLKQ